MTTYLNQDQLAEQFGIPLEEMDEILTEYGLKSSEHATQKAIDEDYAHQSLIDCKPFYHWNILKISELTGNEIQDKIGFYAREVEGCIQIADEFYGDRDIALLAATQAYRDVPDDLWDEVQKRVERDVIGDRRQSCKKCNRKTFVLIKNFCWRCLPEDPYKQQRLDVEAASLKAAAQLAEAGWPALYIENNLEPKDTDIELWSGAVGDAIDTFLTLLADPSKCDANKTRIIVDESAYGQALLLFGYTGFEDHGWNRCQAFLELAYETVAGVFL